MIFEEIESSKTSRSIPFRSNYLLSLLPVCQHFFLHPTLFHPMCNPYFFPPTSFPSTTHSYALLISLSLPPNPSVNPPFLLSHFPSVECHLLQQAGGADSGNSTLVLKMALQGECTQGIIQNHRLEASYRITLWIQPVDPSCRAIIESYPIKPPYRTITQHLRIRMTRLKTAGR